MDLLIMYKFIYTLGNFGFIWNSSEPIQEGTAQCPEASAAPIGPWYKTYIRAREKGTKSTEQECCP
jgi:hypothetical protein